MKKIVFLICLLLFSVNIYAKEEVELSSCVDGDTFKIITNDEVKTVRMLAIDTPETVDSQKEVEYYGKEASNYTCNKLTAAERIEIEYDDNSDYTDKYGRLLGWVFVDGELLQDLLVSNGYAKVAYLYDDYKYTELLQEHEEKALAGNLGIWNEEAKSDYENLNFSDILKLLLLIIVIIIINYLKRKYKKYINGGKGILKKMNK